MGNFKENGHISQEGFLKMLDNQSTALERLELSEHISFCNPCLEYYLSLVEQGTLMIPQESMQQIIFQKAKKSWFGEFRKEFAQATVAASIILLCWSVGTGFMEIKYNSTWLKGQVTQVTEQFTEKVDIFSKKVLESIGK